MDDIDQKEENVTDRPRMDAEQMDIKMAKSLFSRFGQDFVKEMEGLVTLCRENRVRDPFVNGNYLHALTYTELMLRHTTRSFRMLTGGAADGFIAALRPRFEQMLRRLKARKAVARIIVLDGNPQTQLLPGLSVELAEAVEVVHASSSGRGRHFIVADSNMVRDEEWHGPLNDSASADQIHAKVYFDNPQTATAFEDIFDGLWGRLSNRTSQS